MNNRRIIAPRPGHRLACTDQTGAASLIVVMMLLLVMSLVAAYTSRNLIYEQRTSSNHYRATQAHDVAEAGMQWALGRLNGGRIGADCREASATATDTSFRQRYLTIGTDVTSVDGGKITPKLRSSGEQLWPTCVWDGAAWQCDCPSDAAPVVAAPSGTAAYPAFRVRFTRQYVSIPSVVRIDVMACTRLSEDCLNLNAAGNRLPLEGASQMTVVAALKPALPAAVKSPGPAAASTETALTVLGNVAGGTALVAYNTASDRGGVALRASGNLVSDVNVVLRGIPGTPAARARVTSDPALAALAATPGHFFWSMLGALPDTYRLQPAALRLACPPTGCRAALTAAVAANPDRVIWIPGDLVLETAGDIGSPPNPLDPTVAGPVTIVVEGDVKFTSAGVKIYGVVYAGGGAWTGSGEIHGAAMVADNLANTATPTVIADGAVLDTLRLRAGSFVPVPGTWRDFYQ